MRPEISIPNSASAMIVWFDRYPVNKRKMSSTVAVRNSLRCQFTVAVWWRVASEVTHSDRSTGRGPENLSLASTTVLILPRKDDSI